MALEDQRLKALIAKAEATMHESDVVSFPLVILHRENARARGDTDTLVAMDNYVTLLLGRLAEWEMKHKDDPPTKEPETMAVPPVPEPPSMASKMVETIRQDAVDIALRSSVQRVRGIMHDRLATWWVRRNNPRRTGETEDNYRLRVSDETVRAVGFLKTETGESVLALAMGVVWSQASGDIPDVNLRAFGDTVARELRVSAGTDILDGFLVEVVTPCSRP